jgi:hypothetical protein
LARRLAAFYITTSRLANLLVWYGAPIYITFSEITQVYSDLLGLNKERILIVPIEITPLSLPACELVVDGSRGHGLSNEEHARVW